MKLTIDLSELKQEIAQIIRAEVCLALAEYHKKLKTDLPPTPVQYYNIRQVAARLKFAPNTIYRLMDEGKLKCVIVYNRKRVTSEELERFTLQMENKKIERTHKKSY